MMNGYASFEPSTQVGSSSWSFSTRVTCPTTHPAPVARLRDAIVASDAMPLVWLSDGSDHDRWPLPTSAVTHPRSAGCFAPCGCGRDEGMPLIDVIGRCSLLPAGCSNRARPRCEARVVSNRAPMPTSSYSTPSRSPIRRLMPRARGPGQASATSWSTAPSSYETPACFPLPAPAARCAQNQDDSHSDRDSVTSLS